MEFYPIPVALTTGAEWLTKDPASRGHWLALVSYCANQVNGGVLRGARQWRAALWILALGVDPDGIETALRSLEDAGLILWRDDDLVIAYYDPDAEARAHRRSESNSKAARIRWERERAATADANASTTADADADASAMPGEEKKEKRGEESAAGARDQSQRLRERESKTREKRGDPDPDRSPALPGLDVAPDAAPNPGLEVAGYLLEAIRSHHRDQRDQTRRWAEDISKAIRLDGRTPEGLRAVIDFAHRSEAGRRWWRKALLSGWKLRDKYDDIAIDMENGLASRNARAGYASPDTGFAGGEVPL